MLTIDGVDYDVLISRDGIKRNGAILDGENAGRLKSGTMVLDTIGTYFNYVVGPIQPNPQNPESYDALYEAVMSPTRREHTVTMPFGQGAITFECYIANAADTLHKTGNVNRWNGLTLTCTMISPHWRP